LEILAIASVLVVFLTASTLLISRDWRWSMLILAIQYLGVFGLIAIQGSLILGLVKLVAGWMAAAVLAMGSSGTLVADETQGEPRHFYPIAVSSATPSSRLFRLLAIGIVGLAVSSIAASLANWIPEIRLEQAWGALLLIGLGLLHLGLTSQPFYVVVGLLTLLSGFEVIYAAVEASALVTGLLAGVNLGLALVGDYLLLAPTMQEDE
jgi:hypothetical protein